VLRAMLYSPLHPQAPHHTIYDMMSARKAYLTIPITPCFWTPQALVLLLHMFPGGVPAGVHPGLVSGPHCIWAGPLRARGRAAYFSEGPGAEEQRGHKGCASTRLVRWVCGGSVREVGVRWTGADLFETMQ
jgi:hypothetical protein